MYNVGQAIATKLRNLERMPTQEPTYRFAMCQRLAHTFMLLNHNYQLVTVGGTNGKGSCVATLENLLLNRGYRVVSFTSPHMFTFNERIRINGHPIDNYSLFEAFQAIDAHPQAEQLGYFSFAALAALWHFRKIQPDVAILEVGIGGRLDVTNIMNPDISVITNVADDHYDRLGNVKEVIAREKSAITRPGKPLVYGESIMPKAIQARVKECGIRHFQLGHAFSIHRHEHSWDWHGQKWQFSSLTYPNLALESVSCALQVFELLDVTCPPSGSQLNTILSGLTLPGRLQTWVGPPLHYFDVAHNPQAAKKLRDYLTKHQGKFKAVVGLMSHKLVEDTVAPLKQVIDQWHVGQLSEDNQEQQLTNKRIIRGLGGHDEHVHFYGTIETAYEKAFTQCHIDDIIVVFGSFHTVNRIWKGYMSQVRQ